MKTQEIQDILEENERLADPFEPPVCRAAEIWLLSMLFDSALKMTRPYLMKKTYSNGITRRTCYGLQKMSPYGESTHLILTGTYAGFLGKNGSFLRPIFNSPSFSEGEAEAFKERGKQLKFQVRLDEYIPAMLFLLRKIGAKADEKRIKQNSDNFSSLYWEAYFAHWSMP